MVVYEISRWEAYTLEWMETHTLEWLEGGGYLLIDEFKGTTPATISLDRGPLAIITLTDTTAIITELEDDTPI